MLLRQTLLYLPAQFLPAVAQLLSLLVWAHLAGATALGVVTVFVAVQELLLTGFLIFWNVYTLRYSPTAVGSTPDRTSNQYTSTFVVSCSILLQIIAGLGFFLVAIDGDASIPLLATLALLICGRALNSFQAERARSRADISLYSMVVIGGPVGGLLLSTALLTRLGPDYFYIFLAVAVAQGVVAVIGLLRDHDWIGFGQPDVRILRKALRYGLPITVTNLFSWLTQNATRFAVAYFLGLAATGIYSLGFGLGFRAASVAAMSVTAAAFPLAVRLTNSGESEKAMGQLAWNGVLLIAIMQASVAGLLFTASDILRLTVSAELRSSVLGVMVWTLLGGALTYIKVHFLNQVFLLKERTSTLAYLAAAEAAFGVTLAVTAVWAFGLLAGAIAFAANAFLFLSVTFVLSLRIGLSIRWREFVKASAATGVMAVVLMLLPPSVTVSALLIKMLLGATAFVFSAGVLYATDVRKMVTQA